MKSRAFSALAPLAVLVVATLLLSVSSVARAEDIWEAIANDDSAARVAAALDADAAVLNTQGPGGQTPLMFAVLNGKVEAVKLLIARGANATIGENGGYTPMHGAGYQVCVGWRGVAGMLRVAGCRWVATAPLSVLKVAVRCSLSIASGRCGCHQGPNRRPP
jgi:hypothetical protein